MGADGVAQQITHHGGLSLLRQAAQLLIDGPVRIHAVIVVGIDNAEGLLDIGPRAQHGVGGAEGLGAPGRHGIERRQTGIVLHGIADLHRLPVPGRQAGNAVAAQRAHQVHHVVLDDEYDLGEACPNSVVNGVFHEDFAAGAYPVNLFISAIAGAQPSRHDDKRCFHVCFLLVSPAPLFRSGCGILLPSYHIFSAASTVLPSGTLSSTGKYGEIHNFVTNKDGNLTPQDI